MKDDKFYRPRPGKFFSATPLATGVKVREFMRRRFGDNRPAFANYPYAPLGTPKGPKPKFKKLADLAPDQAEDNQAVFGTAINGVAKAYVKKYCQYHDVINDTVGKTPIALVYSAIGGAINAYDRRVGKKELFFACSGLLLRGANVFYDLDTWSLWSGMTGECVAGAMTGKRLRRVPVEFTTLGAWKKLHPPTTLDAKRPRTTLVMEAPAAQTRFGPYGPDYAVGMGNYHGTKLLFYPPLRFRDKLTPPKALVVGVLTPTGTRAYDADKLLKDGKIEDSIGKTKVVVTFNKDIGFPQARTASGKPLFCQRAYWFAWKSNYPKSEYIGPLKRKPEEKPEPKPAPAGKTTPAAPKKGAAPAPAAGKAAPAAPKEKPAAAAK